MKLTYIPCAAAGNVMTDICVSTVASLIRIVGHTKCDFIPEDAAKMALDILDRCRALGWTDRKEGADE
jgi:hypothetical protein